MKYLGIDYGSKNIGLAISDDGGKIAFPYKVLSNNLEFLDNLREICEKEEISEIILGESTDTRGNPNKIMGSIEELKRNIEVELDIPVSLEKEFMTSLHSGLQKTKNVFIAKKIKKVASSATRRGGGEKFKKDDSKAAALILQRFLDKKNK